MPLRNVRYRVKQTSKGPIRLAFTSKGRVVEAKNLKTGAAHSAAEFAADRKKGGRGPKKLSGRARRGTFG